MSIKLTLFGSSAPLFLALLYTLIALVPLTSAATAEQWRARSIYQIVTDRFALEHPSDQPCDPGKVTWCGGTWKAIESKLDYIQDAGFTAVWISPVAQNYLGPRTPYGDPYHGYWVQDISKLNDRFGTSDSLKSLSKALHSRGMFLMVDVVINNVMATTTTPDYSQYFFSNSDSYHPYCPIHWGDRASEMNCWLGDEKVTLPDVKTEDPGVIEKYHEWIAQFVREYSIDGLRIDAAKHVQSDFWPGFCSAAGVFCMGEVFGENVLTAASYQEVLDSVLNYPMYDALVQAFTIPGPSNMSGLAEVHKLSSIGYKDPTLLGNFLENHDNPRWANLSVDPQSMYNALTWTFMTDGIPIVYYGQEQKFHGAVDPWNREAMWPSNYTKTGAYHFIAGLNEFRNYMIFSDAEWAATQSTVISHTGHEIAVIKGQVITVMTSIGSPPSNESVTIYTPWARNTMVVEVLSCMDHVVGSNNTLLIEYSRGGHPSIFVPFQMLAGSGICGYKPFAGLIKDAGSQNAQQSRGERQLGEGVVRLGLWIFIVVSPWLFLSL